MSLARLGPKTEAKSWSVAGAPPGPAVPTRSLQPVKLGLFAGFLAVVVLLSGGRAAGATTVRIKDLATVSGTTGHQLIGYGLVVGLEGTGDSNRALFTARSLANMLEQFGVTVPAESMRADNVAAVMVTAELPPEATAGAKLDATVSSIGDAKSLQGGTLLVTPLLGADGQVCALAQGPVSLGGFNVSAGGSKVQKNHPVVGRVPNGATVTRSMPRQVVERQRVHLVLHNPDFTTAQRVADAINQAFSAALAHPINQAAVEVLIPATWQSDLVGFVAQLESVPVHPDVPARVVINERTGTVIIGGNVRILPVAIAHGGLTIRVKTRWEVSQPPPLLSAPTSENTTVIVGQKSPQPGPQGQSQGSAGGEQGAPAGASAGRQGATNTAAGSASATPQAGLASASPPRAVQSKQVSAQAAAPTKQSANSSGDSQAAAATKMAPAQAGTAAPDSPSALPGPPTAASSQAGAQTAAASPARLPFRGGGHTVVVPQREVNAKEEGGRLCPVPEQASLQQLVEALNALGVKPRDLIAIIQALKEMGALQAELVIQ